jgi:hypothetical protein
MACSGTALPFFIYAWCLPSLSFLPVFRLCGDDNNTLENTLVTKSEEAIAGYFSWQKLLRKARAHVGLSSQ